MTRSKLYHSLPKSVALTSTSLAVATLAASGLMLSTPQQAAAQELCSTHTVISGDRLSTIADTAGVAGGFQALFDANTNVLESPNILEVGQVLTIPCEDGSLPTGVVRVATGTADAAPAPAPTTAQPGRSLRIATATGYAPFTDEDAPGGGLITRMVSRSMEVGNPDQEFDMLFINDWGSHLETLLPSGAIDMVFPWFKPDCDRVENLSPASAYRCTDFNHSAPLYEALVGYYTLAGGEYQNAASYSDLFGATLCRPEAWFTFDLEAQRLMPPNVELRTTVPQNGCWELLQNGEVDIVTLDALPAEEDYRELGLEGQITKLEALTSGVTMHVFVSKNNAFANEALPIINAGLQELRLSGEWFNIVREGIRDTVEN
ncbi:amino acid ABC transporter substrate-binding protein (PAAT family) [Yoonia maricola]|uniref:Amino acid ABC transporter substrate-binding protein (PAAT family) n=1 Tax=Yoonia maricola TaxID=420999 RepID=A0A2M8WMG6_9RHOB|nr:LysM peptidoglycan-binding domain-containing protein [Yoonia maricola]PJI92121.1 amino acid ABC transporter substrate-binding protein (PAAT family) [Yoonia maricola]